MPDHVEPNHAATLNALMQQVASLRQAGKLPESVPLLREALRLAPGNADLHNELGLTLIHLGQPQPAQACFETALARNPSHGRAHLNLGKLLEQFGRPGAAFAYRRAVECAPTSHEAHARLASMLEQQGQRSEASTHYTQAASLTPPTSPQGQLYRTRVAMIAPTLAVSEQALRELLAQDPTAHPARAALGKMLSARGAFDDAATQFEHALQANPADIALYFDLVRTRRLTAADAPLIARMRASLTLPAPIPAQLRLRTALAKALDDTGNHTEAAEALSQLAQLRATHHKMDRAALTALTNQMIGLFTPSYLARPQHRRAPSALPILVLGLPRTGTTLTERILARHPEIAGAGELGFWETHGPGLLATLHADQDADLIPTADAYLARLRAAPGAATASRIADKNPCNFRWALLAHLALPHARIVHCRRHPADTALSIMLAALQPQRLFATSPDDLLFCFQEHERLMAHLRALLPPERFYELAYEDLVADPEPQIRRLLAFCGVDFAPSCLTPQDSEQAVLTASLWQARQPINQESVGRWRDYPDLLAPFVPRPA